MNAIESKNFRILVVDDEKNMRTVISQMVDFAGYECMVATCGEEAIRLMSENPVDVLITDIVMPGMDGIKLTVEAKEKFDVDVIVVTGYTKEYTFDQIAGHGVSDFIAQPIRTDELVIRLKRVLRERMLFNEREQAKKALINSERQLRSLTIRLKEVEEELRRRIARELHDRVGQNLSALNLNLTLLSNYLPENLKKKTGPVLDDSMKLLTETAEHIRDVMARLRPVGLDEYGLAPAIKWYVDRFSARTGIVVEVKVQEYKVRLPLKQETEFFRITQEALTNILKHADAQNVIVAINSMDNRIRLSIIDDGKGFDVGEVCSQPTANGWGLISMRERANSFDGTFKVISETGKGTKVVVEVTRE